jgi:hypothetical protein
MKKFLPIIIIVIAVAVIATIGFFSVKIWKEKSGEIGIGGKSLMEIAEEQGEEIMSKQEWIKGCKESDPEAKDACYAMGAFYYRDASFCKNIKDAETRQECSQEKIEEAYKELEEMGKELEKLTPEEREQMQKMMEEGYSGMAPMMSGGMPGFLPYIPEVGEEGAGEEGETIENESEQQREMPEQIQNTEEEIEEQCVEIMAHSLYLVYLVESGDRAEALAISDKIEKLMKEYNMTDEYYDEVCNEKAQSLEFTEKLERRLQELGYESN